MRLRRHGCVPVWWQEEKKKEKQWKQSISREKGATAGQLVTYNNLEIYKIIKRSTLSRRGAWGAAVSSEDYCQ